MRTSGELGYPTPTCTALLGNGNQRASPNLRAPCRFFFGIAQRKSLAKRKARENALLNLTSNIDESEPWSVWRRLWHGTSSYELPKGSELNNLKAASGLGVPMHMACALLYFLWITQ